ncbi:hypothetical protein AALO_G00119890 [Alosa alosa]|uniref:PDZK1-interacting protein 1 n=1 Tax=Alosa alosa TaxID=278164 RepID=A0AAV6GJP4_9TELE|nr:PDZK1-interacting protein 1 [Alosa alosa]KAG5275404.1 hypothetical protein AALO_G00119890 [Alosa alosa]
MRKVFLLFSWFLVMSGVVSAQTETTQRALPNWLTGIVAGVVFLFLVFVAFLVNKAWCSESRLESKVDAGTSNEYGMTNGSTWSAENACMNNASDGTEDKVTVM